jgi:hypothetical protein
MQLFIGVLFINLISFLIGHTLLNAIGIRQREDIKYLSMLSGLSLYAFFSYLTLLIVPNHWKEINLALALGLIAVSVYNIYKKKLYTHIKTSSTLLILGLTFFITYPFWLYLTPPDADAMMFGYYASLVKSGQYPTGFPWGETFAQIHIIPPVAFANLTALASTFLPYDIAFMLLIITCSFVIASCLTIMKIGDNIYNSQNGWLPLILLFAFLNSTYTYEYGDGSITRTAATAISLLWVYFLLCKNNSKVPTAVLVGLFHGISFYFHYRFFIWNSIILGAWLIFQALRYRNIDHTKNLFVVPLVSLLAISPFLFSKTSAAWDFILSGRENLSWYEGKHNLKAEQLFNIFSRYQTYVSHIIVILGIIWYTVIDKKKNSLILFSIFYYCIMVLFFFDKLILSLVPQSYNILYPQMAILSNFSIPKFVMLTYLTSQIYPYLKTLDFSTAKKKAILSGTTGFIIIVGYFIYSGFSKSPFKLTSLIQINLTEYIISFTLLLIATVILLLVVWKKLSFPYFFISILACFAANEMKTAKFFYPYITEGDREAFIWLKNNTSYDDTLVLSNSYLDIDHNVWTSNFRTIAEKGNPLHYSDITSHWLPVISERKSVFNRLNIFDRLAGASAKLSQEKPELELLDKAYWNPHLESSCEVMRRNKVTHIHYVRQSQIMMKNRIKKSPCISKVFSAKSNQGRYMTPDKRWNNRASIYRVNY